MTLKGLSLVRNRHFRVWSPLAQPDGYVDRIEWTFGVEPKDQFDAVERGEADLGFEALAPGGLEEMFVRLAAQVHVSPSAWTDFAVLNTKERPFNDIRVRRALNLALDRERVVQIIGGGEGAAVPTCQQLPPNFPGYEPFCPYTADPGAEGLWTAPDLEKAKRLVDRSDTGGMRVVIEYYPPYWGPGGPALADYLVGLLKSLGYAGTVKPLPTQDPDDEFDLALDVWIADYPAASTFIANRFTCGATYVASGGLCDAELDEMIEEATRMQADNPSASGPLWAAIDRAIVDKAPYLWLVNETAVTFVSERVRNFQSGLQWGVLLNQLWVK